MNQLDEELKIKHKINDAVRFVILQHQQTQLTYEALISRMFRTCMLYLGGEQTTEEQEHFMYDQIFNASCVLFPREKQTDLLERMSIVIMNEPEMTDDEVDEAVRLVVNANGGEEHLNAEQGPLQT